jgi:glucosamine--fructose-6-phosphate aminotransferase (isomerizing)
MGGDVSQQQAPRAAMPVSFREGCVSQLSLLPVAVDVVSEQLESGSIDGLRGRSLLFAGIGASFAANGTPVHQLRASGIRAYRTDCSDVPDGAPQLADAYVAVSQSGRSRETVQLLLAAPDVYSLAITNSTSNPLLNISTTGMSLGGLPDSRVSSIGFTATLLALGMVADRLTIGQVDAGWSAAVAALPEVLDEAEDALRLFASDVVAAGQVDVIAESSQITSSEQAGLLFREGPRVPSTAMTTRPYLHGPMDVAGHGTSHIVIGREREGVLAEQLTEQSGKVLLISDRHLSAPVQRIQIPDGLTSSQRALIEIALLQSLVSFVGAEKGEDVDGAVFQRLDTKVDTVDDVRRGRV